MEGLGYAGHFVIGGVGVSCTGNGVEGYKGDWLSFSRQVVGWKMLLQALFVLNCQGLFMSCASCRQVCSCV